MNIIKDIITDYEKLIKTSIQIPLSNSDVIKFSFHPQDLPHLLGLQYLVDNPYLFEYSEKRLSATDLFNRMCGKGEAINTDDFEDSVYFSELYEGRIKYFSSDLILDIINSRQIVKFDPTKVKNFSTKLEKIEYMFWKKYKDKDNNYGYFGVGFMSSGKDKDINYPNTFFFRLDNDYMCNQDIVYPYSMMKKDKWGIKEFSIYWDEVWKGMQKNKHYKFIKKNYELDNGNFNIKTLKDCKDALEQKHYELLKLDALDKIYIPYMKKDFRWTNDEKRFILHKIDEAKRDLFPEEIRNLLNEFRQKTNK